jgi:Protein of unknown function (DUF1488)
MTLSQGRFIAYEHDRMIVLLSMLDGEKEIACAISISAMDELDSVAGTRAGQREAHSCGCDRMEACADGKYRATEFEGVPPGIILRSIDSRRQR